MQTEQQRRKAFASAQLAYDNAEPEDLPDDEDEQEEQDDPEHWWP